MHQAENYYSILQIQRDAEPKQIRKAFYSLAKIYHPDKVEENKKAEGTRIFQSISLAYCTLSNPKKRFLYDLGIGVEDCFSTELRKRQREQDQELLDLAKNLNNFASKLGRRRNKKEKPYDESEAYAWLFSDLRKP